MANSKNSSQYVEASPIPERLIANNKHFRDPRHRFAIANLYLYLYGIFMTVAGCIFLAGYVYELSKPKEKVLAVMLDKDTGVTVGQQYLKPREATQVPDVALEYFLVKVITTLRTIPTDRNLYVQNVAPAYKFLTKTAKAKVEDFINNKTITNEILTDKIKSITTNIKSFNAVTNVKNTYQIRWSETAYQRGQVIAEKHYSAILTVGQVPITEIGEDRSVNPFGIVVRDISITEEIVSK